MKPSSAELTHLLQDLILPFYLVKRDMRVPIGPRRRESSTEHSWALALMVSALAPLVDPNLNAAKACQFAVVHDLVELYAADTSPFESQTKIDSKAQREKAALSKIEEDFKQFPWIAQTIREYERRDTNEARFVWAADKYITLLTRHLDDGKFYRSIKLTKEKFEKRVAANRAKAHAHKTIGEYYDLLREEIDARPDHFYQQEGRVADAAS